VAPTEHKVLSFGDILSDYYHIDEFGNIYNIARQREVKAHPDKDGYLHLLLCTNERLPNGNHRRKDFRIAPLVARSFIGEPPKKLIDPTVDHKDGCITHNHYSNLRWLDRGTNSSIRKNTGLGELNHEAKLSYNDVHQICEMLTNGVPQKEIAMRFNVPSSTIGNIKQRKNWRIIWAKLHS
jgi:hypothetical protein